MSLDAGETEGGLHGQDRGGGGQVALGLQPVVIINAALTNFGCCRPGTCGRIALPGPLGWGCGSSSGP